MKILIRGTNWIGDAVMTIPALRELARLFPDDHITLQTSLVAQDVFEEADYINEIITFKKKNRIKSFFEQVEFLRVQKFDLAVLLTNSFESALIACLARIPKRFGYGKDGRGLLLTDRITVPDWKDSRSEVFYYLNLISAVEKSFFGTRTVGDISQAINVEMAQSRRLEAQRQLEENGVDLQKKIITLGAGSTNSRAKRWPAENYAALNDRIQRELNAGVIIVGSKGDMDVSARIYELAKFKPIVLSGKTSVSEAAAILRLADLFISNDMGLAHIAPAVGTKTIVIFGPTNEKTTRPFSDLAEVMRHPVECSPCMLRDCPIDHRCMTRISVDDVFERAKEILNAEDARDTEKNKLVYDKIPQDN